MSSLGLKANKLTNIWVPFVVGSVEQLEPSGRLAMVIPAELLQVTYAAQLRKYLTERFEHIGLFACNELFFYGAQQEVLLVLAEGALAKPKLGHSCGVSLAQVGSVTELLKADPAKVFSLLDEKHVKGDSEKWLKYFLTSSEIEFMRELRQHKRIKELSHFARVDVGVVTGKNEFFVLRGTEIKLHNLAALSTRLISRAAHLRGAVIDSTEWKSLAESNERVHLFDASLDKSGRMNAATKRYIADGEAKKFNTGYKCSIRETWYQVPSIWTPDGFLFRQIHDFPRFVRNRASATSTDTIHRFTAHGCDADELTAITFTHLTAASAEIEGRSYGGGVLELEPTEAERLLIPDALGNAVPLADADKLVRNGKLNALLEENDKLVLRKSLGLTKSDCALLKGVWEKMRDRRIVRKRKIKGD
jgi:adenine-specific DNA methylase